MPELYRSVCINEIENKGWALTPSKYIEFIDHDLDIDYEKEMVRIQSEMKDILKQEKKSQQMLEAAFRGLVMGLINIRLGDYIERSTINNKDLKYGVDLIVGVNSQGVFATPKGNTDGVDLKPYKIVENGAFVYNPTRLELGSIAYRTEGLCIVISFIYGFLSDG